MITIVLYVFATLALLYGIHKIAEQNFIFTTVPEGGIKILTFFGAFFVAFLQYSGHAFRWLYHDQLEELKDGNGEDGWKDPYKHPDPWDIILLPDKVNMRLWMNIVGGLRLILVAPWLLHWDKLRFMSLQPTKKEGGNVVDELSLKEIETDVFYARADIYGMNYEGVETGEFYHWDLQIIITGWVCNPKKMFRVDNPIEFVLNRLRPPIREFMGPMGYKDILILKKVVGKTRDEEKGKEKKPEYGLSSALLGRLLEMVIDELRDVYGFWVDKVEVFSIEPADKATREVLTRPVTASIDAEVVEITAGAEKKRIEITFAAIANFGGLGRMIKALEAIEVAGGKDGHGNWVVPFNISQMIGDQNINTLTGVLDSAGITEDDLNSAISELKKFRGEEEKRD